MTKTNCLCKSGLSYSDCCEPYHNKSALPPTALKLMRSRYSAYVLYLVDYLVNTTHPEKLKSRLRKNLLSSIDQLTWTNLTILKTSLGTQMDKRGKVAFEATYIENGNQHTLVEHSRFRKREGKWFYYDGKG